MEANYFFLLHPFVLSLEHAPLFNSNKQTAIFVLHSHFCVMINSPILTTFVPNIVKETLITKDILISRTEYFRLI